MSAYCIVIGNEKGGSGKSTTAVHLAVSLMKEGFKVATVDADAYQGTLSRYIENRQGTASKKGVDLLIPDHSRIYPSELSDIKLSMEKDEAAVQELMTRLRGRYDFIVCDTPGYRSHMSRCFHNMADTLVTPLNDSFIDVDVIAHIDSSNLQMASPSTYAAWVWEMKKNRAMSKGASLDWIVMRNRLSALYDRNKGNMEKALGALSKRLGFRVISGFSERVIFKEFFLQGITLFDLKLMKMPSRITHIAAKAELYALMQAINVEKLASLKEVG